MKLHVSNLPVEVREAEVMKLFQTSGAVASVVIVRNRKTGLSKGYGFVVMHDRSEAEAAISKLNEYKLNENSLIVCKALPVTKAKNYFDPAGKKKQIR